MWYSEWHLVDSSNSSSPHLPPTQTLERSYLLRINGQVIERPQHMLMRVAVGMHKDNIEAAIETYHLMSERWFTHASPTLFNRLVQGCSLFSSIGRTQQRFPCLLQGWIATSSCSLLPQTALGLQRHPSAPAVQLLPDLHEE